MSGTIDIVDLPELVAIGIALEGERSDLPVAVSKAWHRLFERDTGATSFLAISIGRDGALCREFVGYLAATKTAVPDGLTRLIIPARRYLRLLHYGPVAAIADGFVSLYSSAAVQGLRATDFKLDFGYQPGLADGRHELHVAIDTPKGLLGHV